MINLPAINPNSVQTMSSREIAELTGSRHDSVKKSAQRLSADHILTSPLADTPYPHPQNGQTYYEYNFNKTDSLILVARLSPAFTAHVVKRWQELEEKTSAPAWVASLSPEARIAIEDISRQKDEAIALIEEQKPKVEFANRISESQGNKTFRQVCKLLKVKENQFRQFLTDQKIMYPLAGGWMAYQNHIDAGRFYVSGGVADNEHAYTTCKFTPKGIEYIGGKWITREVV